MLESVLVIDVNGRPALEGDPLKNQSLHFLFSTILSKVCSVFGNPERRELSWRRLRIQRLGN